jgi:hypothetical protein
MRWVCSTNGEKEKKWRSTYRFLVGNPEGKRPLRGPKRSWMDNIKADLGDIECDGMDLIWLSIGIS